MALTAAVLLAVAAFGLSLWPGSRPGSSAKVLFYDSGFLDWDRPVYGRYGPFETGMFGSLQDYLAASGIRCELTRELSAASFQGVNALVVINPTNRWSDAQLESIWAYVESGGSLLVLGDHTDIMGSQAVLNTLLAPVNVRFKFDSGFPARPEWLNCLKSLVHPTTWRASKTTETLISVGASLELQPPAFTVIWGRYGFSDLGNRLNTQGAFLGDYRHQRGEQLGDVSLVAAAYYGRGKVLVFGDTSPFQNGALASTFESFVQPVFAWLTMRDWRFWGVLKWIGAVILVGSLGVLVQRGPVWASGAGGLLLAAMMTAGLAFERNRMPLPALEGSVAWIDLAHANRVALEPFQTDSIGPLPIALMRNGLLPLFKSRWSSEELHRASVVISTAPARKFSAREQRALSEFVRGGGVFLLNCGWDEKGDATKELLDQFGLDVLRIPLGPFPVTRTRDHLLNQPQCINAWAVAVTDPSAQADFEAARKQYRPVPLDTDQAQRLDEVVRGMFEIQGAPGPELLPPRSTSSTVASPETNRPPASVEVLFQTEEGLPLILVRRWGKGAVVLIGDTFFLGHDNLENLQYYRKGNLLFLKHLFDTVRPGQI